MKNLFYFFTFLLLFTTSSSAFIVGDWDFEDNNNNYVNNIRGSVIDKSGNNIPGSPFNGPNLSTDTPTGSGHSVAFDQSNSSGYASHLFLNHDSKMSMDSGKVSFWFKPERLAYQGLLSKDHTNTATSGHLTFIMMSSELGYGDGDYPSSFHGYYLAVRLQAADGSDSSYYSYVVMPDYVLKKDTWYYVEFVFGDMDFGMRAILYNQNMQELARSSYPFYGGMSKIYGKNVDSGAITIIEDVKETTSIGALSWYDARGAQVATNYFQGKMDSLLWETNENLVIVHRFDECEQTKNTKLINHADKSIDGTLSDSTIKGNTSEMFTNGKISRGLSITGKNDYVNLDKNLINSANIYDFSLLVWIKTTNDGIIIDTNNDDIKLSISNNQILATVKGTNYTFSNPYTIKDNQWHQLILTRKVRKRAEFSSGGFPDQAKIDAYVDGHDLGTFYTTKNENKNVIEKINVGWMQLGSNFNGYIDEFSLLKNKLSEFSAESILGYQERGLNWDGTTREEYPCAVPIDANISINDVSKLEGNSGTTSFTFTVALDTVSTENISVNYATSNGTATTADSDYSAKSGTVNFTAGETSKTVTILVNGDTKVEPDETFNVTLSNPANALIADGTGIGTILNDDSLPTLSINDIQKDEGDSGTTDFDFTVSLSRSYPVDVTVDYLTTDGSATTADSDYQALTSQTLTIPAGQTTATITVKVNGDTIVESDETFNIILSNPSNASISDDTGVGTILNDDSYPGITINDIQLNEGNSGTTNFTFTVSLDNAYTSVVSVNYATSNGTASTADNDYSAKSGTVNFTAGETSKAVTILVNGDTKVEPDETFNVTLSNPANALIADGTGIGTILNDDSLPTLSIDNIQKDEGDSGTTDFDFTVSLSRSYPVDVTVDYVTTDGTATTADSDYQALTSQTLTIPAGQTTATITAKVNGDTIVESDETFNIILSNPSNASISDDTGVGTILNDDSYPGITINDIQLNEGNSGTTNFTFTVSLDNAYTSVVSVNYATSNGTATTADNDYSAKSGTVNFAAGETSKTVTILVNGDTKVEPNETFNVTLSNPTNSTISKAIGVGTILKDDFTTIGINDVQKEEGDSSTTDFTFTLTLDRPSYTSVSVDYRTSNGSAETADSDYNAASGTLTIAAGETTATITVTVNGDTKIEQDETFTLTLSSPSNTTLGKSVGTGTIINDDFASLSVADVGVLEGDDGITNLTFTLNLSEAFYDDVTLNYATQDGTATVADNDYLEVNATQVTFAPNETSKEINISVVGDLNIEDDETLFLLLSNPTNATISDGNATGTIENDDIAILSINDVNLSEGNIGYTDFNFTVSMTLPHREDVTVSYATSDGTALISDNDYNQTQGTLTFTAGETEKTVTVKVIGDFFIEDDETFTVTLSDVSTNAYISTTDGTGTGTGTILNDDSGTSTDKVTFNVERTNSATDTIGSDARNAWYTQISGRPFDYDVVSYDKAMANEYPMSNLVVKVSLRSIDDRDTQIDTEQYLYFSDNHKRETFTNLQVDSAHKYAIFRIFVPTNGAGIILKTDCSGAGANYKKCYDDLKDATLKRKSGFNDFSIDARDNFAIRPAGLHYGVSINNSDDIIDNIPPKSTDKAFAAGENYYLSIYGRRYDDVASVISTYTNSNVKFGVEFDDASGNCNDKNDYNTTLPVNTGSAYTISFKNNQVGIYKLSALDEEWTQVDKNKGDCDVGKSDVSPETDGTTKSGCNIGSEVTFNGNTYENDSITFHPHHFDVNVSASTKPENLELVYMHTIEGTDSNMSAQIDANVTALSKTGTKLSNFTKECMAQDVQYTMNISSDPEVLQDTLLGDHSIFVNVDNHTYKIEDNVSSELTLAKDKFTKDENGTAPITLNYNIDRTEDATTNPVAVTFNTLHVSSEEAKYNTTSGIQKPTGDSSTSDTNNFLYARVRASQKLYEGDLNDGVVSTPLAMDVYCQNDPLRANLCINPDGTGVFGIRTSLTGDNWWLATASATSNEVGTVTLDNVNENNISVPNNITNRTDVLDRDNAINLNVTVNCPNANAITEIRLIDPSSSWIRFDNNPLYSVRCSGSGDWAGTGNERSVVDGAKTRGARLDADGNRNNAPAPANQITKTHRLSW